MSSSLPSLNLSRQISREEYKEVERKLVTSPISPPKKYFRNPRNWYRPSNLYSNNQNTPNNANPHENIIAGNNSEVPFLQDTVGISEENNNFGTCIDYCTCMICVKAFYYVCIGELDETGTPLESPCFCTYPSKKCFKRWSLLGLISCFIPCLLCYPPATGCLHVWNKCKRKRKERKERIVYKVKWDKEGNIYSDLVS